MSFIRHGGQTSLDKCAKGCRTTTSDVLVTSSGVPSFDKLFISGISVGSIIAIREDWPRSLSNYSSCLLKCICAEGLISEQNLLFVDGLGNGDSFLDSLPGLGKNEESGEPKTSKTLDEKMTIAWRYKHLKSFEDEAPSSPKFQENTFDFGKKTKAKGANCASISILDPEFEENLFLELNRLIQVAKANDTILRIVLYSFASPLYQTSGLAKLLFKIRSVVGLNSSNAIVFMTIPAHNYPAASTILADIEGQCDMVLEMQSFIGTPQEKIRALNEYNGFLRIIKPLRIPGSLALALPETNDIAFKLKRRQLMFEPFHMPPDLEDTSTASKPSGAGCNSMESNKLDF